MEGVAEVQERWARRDDVVHDWSQRLKPAGYCVQGLLEEPSRSEWG